MDILTVSVLTAGFAMGMGSLFTALAQGWATSKAVEGISRQPEASGKITGTLIIGLAIIESIAIYVLAVCIIILYANPITQPARDVSKAQAANEVIKLEIEKVKLEAELAKVKPTDTKAEKTGTKK
jgi:F-type H+-transporting ATPase subunit c